MSVCSDNSAKMAEIIAKADMPITEDYQQMHRSARDTQFCLEVSHCMTTRQCEMLRQFPDGSWHSSAALDMLSVTHIRIFLHTHTHHARTSVTVSGGG